MSNLEKHEVIRLINNCSLEGPCYYLANLSTQRTEHADDRHHAIYSQIWTSRLQGDEATGIYAATDRLIVTMATGIAMFGSALFPVMSRFANELVYITFRFKYHSYGLLVATDQQNKIIRIQLRIILGFIIACLVLIPQFSFIGLAYAKLATSVALCIAFSWYLSKTLHTSPVVKNITAPFIACLSTIIIFKLMIGQGLWISLLSAALTCGITLLLTGAVKHHDLSYLRNILLGKVYK